MLGGAESVIKSYHPPFLTPPKKNPVILMTLISSFPKYSVVRGSYGSPPPRNPFFYFHKFSLAIEFSANADCFPFLLCQPGCGASVERRVFFFPPLPVADSKFLLGDARGVLLFLAEFWQM